MQFWNFISKETGERELRLNGAISDETWLGNEVTPKQFREELNAGTGDITVWINSPGGDIFAAAEIFNQLRAYRGKVTVKIDSLAASAASAASVVAMAGDTVEISPVGMMMIHNPQTAAIGDTREFKAAIDMLEEVRETIINAYERKAKLPRAEISKLMDNETWLNARRAVELGFADKIISEEKISREDYSAKQFSQRKVTNSLREAFKSRREPSDKGGVAVAGLRRRLDFMTSINDFEWRQD